MINRDEVVKAYGDNAMNRIASDLGVVDFKERSKTGLCPVHSEKTGSFTFDPKTNIFHCFGCGHNVDIVSHVIDYNNLSYVQAVKEICEEIGIDPEIENRDNSQNKRQDEKKYKKPFVDSSDLTDKMIKYANDRGIKKSTLEFWRVTRLDNKSFRIKSGEYVNRTAYMFNSYDEYNELVNISYRSGDKLFAQESDCNL